MGVVHSITFFPLFFLFIIIPHFLYAEDLGIIQTDEIIVLFQEPLGIAAKEVMDIYGGLKRELEEILRWPVNFRPTVLLIKNSNEFQRIAGNKSVVALAVSQKNLVVIDYSKMNTHPFTLGITLKHELCHLLLHHHIKKTKLPKWLDEGVSQWVSDGVAEMIMDRKRSVLKEAIRTENYIGIDSLATSFPEHKKSLMLAYEESRSLVAYIGSKFGKNGILDILKYLKEGYEVDAAILKALSIPLDDLERRWHSHLRKNTTWFTFLITNLYEILFFLGAMITIYGFIRLLIKKRGYEDEETGCEFIQH